MKISMKKITALLLSGVLCLTAFVSCGDDKKDSKDDTDSVSIEERLTSALDSLSNVVANPKDINKAVTGSASVSLGDYFKDTESVSNFKPISVEYDTKMKDGNASVSGKFLYDSKDLLEATGYYSIDDSSVYVGVPTLSSSYIKVNSTDFSELLNSLTAGRTEDEEGEVSGLSAITSQLGDLSSIKDAAKELVESYDKIIDAVKEAIESSLPKATKEEMINSKISDIEYTYTAKTYTINDEVRTKLLTALYKTDSKELKKFIMKINGLTEDTYDAYVAEEISAIGKETEDYDEDGEEVPEEGEITLYYDGDDIMGIDGVGANFMVVEKEKSIGLSFATTDPAFMTNITLTGIINDDDNLDMSLDCDLQFAKVSAKIDNFKEDDNNLVSYTGNITMEKTSTDDESDADTDSSSLKFNKISVDMKSSIDGKKQSDTTDISIDEKTAISLSSSMEITEASDISIPSDNIIEYKNIDEYQATLDPTKLMTNLQTALGEEKFNELFATIGGLTGGDSLSDSTDFDAVA